MSGVAQESGTIDRSSSYGLTMSTTSHQTIRLSRGRHRSPDDGVCAVELASILAGESFSDHPGGVCPVIGGFVRSYNDHVDDRRRRDLFPYAALIVGTRAGSREEETRGAMCLRWAHEACDPPSRRVRMLHRIFGCQGPDVHAVYAARAAAASGATRIHREALALLDRLIGVTAGSMPTELISGDLDGRGRISLGGKRVPVP